MKLPTRSVNFGAFDVTSSVFHTTPHTFAIVNLKPLLPGHVLICPHHFPGSDAKAPPSRVSQLTHQQRAALLATANTLLPTLTRLYSAQGYNFGIQDGAAAGQSVSHVHLHIVPRKNADMDDRGGGDKLYEMMEGEEGDLGKHMRESHKPMPESVGEREPRGLAEMIEEANMLRSELEKDGVFSTPPESFEIESGAHNDPATKQGSFWESVNWNSVFRSAAWIGLGFGLGGYYMRRTV